MIPAISYVAREFVRERLEDNAAGFNAFLQQTAATYNVVPFTLDSTTNPPTLFLGRYDYDTVRQITGSFTDNINFGVMSVAKSDDTARFNLRVTPSTFAGNIIVSVEFYIRYNQSNLPPDGEAMYHAVEDAMVFTFNTPDSYSLVPPGLLYNNEVMVEQGRMEWQQDRYIQVKEDLKVRRTQLFQNASG